MRNARTAAALTWIYAAAFGIPAFPVAIYLRQRGVLPEFPLPDVWRAVV